MISTSSREQSGLILDHSGLRQGALFHATSGTHLLRHEAPTSQNATVYRPLLCLILQGAKDVGTSAKTLTVRAGQSLIVSHALPVLSRIIEAAPEMPYIALVFPLDLDLLRTLAPAVLPSSISTPPSTQTPATANTSASALRPVRVVAAATAIGPTNSIVTPFPRSIRSIAK